jgi:copper chaperone CopZ
MLSTSHRRLAAALAAGALAAPLAACGGSSSSAPGYCKAREDLKSSIAGLSRVDIRQGGVDSIKAQLQKVQGDAQALVSSAKSDFPKETGAISSSIDALRHSVSSLSSSPSLADVTQLATQVSSAASAVKSFDKAASAKC